MFNLNSFPQSPENQSSSMYPKRRTSLYFNLGVISAFVSLFVIPELFGSVAIVLGAYTWRLESGENKNRGLVLIIFGIVTMLIGIYYTSLFGIYNILP